MDNFVFSLMLGLLEVSELLLLLHLLRWFKVGLMLLQKLSYDLFESLQLNILQF